EVFEIGGQAIEKARTGGGPTVLWCDLDRLASHTSADDHRVYRSAEEIAEMMDRDPIKLFAGALIGERLLAMEEVKQMQVEIEHFIDTTYQEATSEPAPDPTGVLEHLYGPAVDAPAIPFQPLGQPATMVEAINQALHAGMEKFPRIVTFGEDIEDPKGGVF